MACAEIRDNLRTNLSESRQLNRDKVLGIKRKALKDLCNVGRELTSTEVTIIGNKLKHKSMIQLEDLALLKLAFVQNASNIVAFLKLKGALHGLIRELSSNKSNYQLAAAECCCNLALGDEWSCLQVAKAAGPYLMSMLSGCNYNLISTSVWTLGNLAGSDKATWNILHSQGFMGKLLQLIEEYDTIPDIPGHSEIQQNSLNALVQLINIGYMYLMPEEMMDIAKAVTDICNISGKSLRVCEYLLSCFEELEEELLENDVHMRCLKFMKKTELTDETVASFTAAVRTIANLVAEPSGDCIMQVLTKWTSFQDTTQKIYCSPYPHLVNELGWLFGNLVNHPSEEVQLALKEHDSDFELFYSQFVFFNKP